MKKIHQNLKILGIRSPRSYEQSKDDLHDEDIVPQMDAKLKFGGNINNNTGGISEVQIKKGKHGSSIIF